jgi:hypothetical protein
MKGGKNNERSIITTIKKLSWTRKEIQAEDGNPQTRDNI